MTQLLYHETPYKKEFNATVLESNNNFLVLDKTLFYPKGGGQPTDTGIIEYNNKEVKVKRVFKENGKIIHEADESIPEGAKIKGIINWDLRYKYMKMHTAQHLVSAIVLDEFNVETVGNQINWPTSRIDFNFKPGEEDLELITKKFNELVDKEIEVNSYEVDRSQVPNEVTDPKRLSLFNRIPSTINKIRISEIDGIDKNPCGGIQVKNTKEIGYIKIEKTENVGKGKTRIIYSLV